MRANNDEADDPLSFPDAGRDLAADDDKDDDDEIAEASEAVAEVVDAIDYHEADVVAEAEEIDDAARVDAQNEDIPITSTTNVGDKEDENEDDEDDDEYDDRLSFLDAGKALATEDDKDEDDDDFDI
ncbi:nucleolin-like [Cynara cardunculus var. scolymus]|uniref:nucleolin-like n=1 Tax=Cynara cardunculus var. scolymus TaxID=59895 RepID=UPI000D62A754|nr:nucleolin-like [Cynara cardunculus var. scolymus]